MKGESVTTGLPTIFQVKRVRDDHFNRMGSASYRESYVQKRQLETLNWILAEMGKGRSLESCLDEIAENQTERQFETHISTEAEERTIELLNEEGVEPS